MKPPRIYLKPAAGRRVVNPATGLPLPAEGEGVVGSAFWDRRLRDQDVVAARPARTTRSTKAKSKGPQA